MSRLEAIGQSGPRQVETPGQDQLAPWADQIYQWIAKDRLQLTRIHKLLMAGGYELSYQSLRRFVLKRNWQRVSKTAVRMGDTLPGEVSEADFGRLGMITDPATGRRQAEWAIVIVLCHSRHCFVADAAAEVERILVQALEEESTPQLPLPMPSGRFARPGDVFSHTTTYRRQSA